jgi:hypothetical protein
MKRGIWYLIVASLTACASQPTEPPRPQLQRPTALQAMINTCDLSTRPDLQILNGKLPLSLNQIQQPGVSQLSTERGPTADEQAALVLYDQLHRSCVQAQANWLVDATFGTMPEVSGLQQKMFASEQSHLAALYRGNESFAQFTKEVNGLHVGFMNEFGRMAQSAYDKTQEQMRSSAPVQTNCQAYSGGSVRCTTQ